jgi:hypothetical protein
MLDKFVLGLVFGTSLAVFGCSNAPDVIKPTPAGAGGGVSAGSHASAAASGGTSGGTSGGVASDERDAGSEADAS